FWDGAKALSTNKYFWIIVVYQIIITIRANVNIVDFIRQYSYPGNPALAGFIEVIGKTVLMTAFVVGMVVGPIVMKKFGKRKVMITANVGFVTFSLLQLATYKIPIIVVFCTFFQNVFAGFDFITCIMTSDALDFEQYRHGKRVEGFWQNFMAMITTVASLFVTMVPVFLAAAAGIGFGDDYAEKMTDLVTRENLYLYRSLVGVAAGAIAAIPIFFYDMTEKQHSSIVKALRIRAAKDDFATGTITDGQIVELKGIVDYAYEYNDSFIIGKIAEFSEIEQVLAMYDDAKAREDAKFAQEELENFERNIELETKKLDAKIAKQKEVCAKKNIEFDEKNFVEELVYHNRWLIRLEQYADIKARKDADNLVAEKAKFDSQIAKEEAKYAKMIAKEKSKCLKKNIEFN
ncbi:MAG: MFS transporter, partial [Clostridia bacterium]|nr:MFS transporter [Clostridia bacterium]